MTDEKWRSPTRHPIASHVTDKLPPLASISQHYQPLASVNDVQAALDEFKPHDPFPILPKTDGREHSQSTVIILGQWFLRNYYLVERALAQQQPDEELPSITRGLLEACKKAADIFRDYERIHLSKSPPDRSKAERNGEYAYVMEQAIARAEQKGGE